MVYNRRHDQPYILIYRNTCFIYKAFQPDTNHFRAPAYHLITKMSFFTSMTSFLPTSTTYPHAFSLFRQNQNPRETHTQYAELYSALHPRSRKEKENTKSTHVVPKPKSRSATFVPSAHCTYISQPPPPYSPREARATYHGLREALRPSNGGQ